MRYSVYGLIDNQRRYPHPGPPHKGEGEEAQGSTEKKPLPLMGRGWGGVQPQYAYICEYNVWQRGFTLIELLVVLVVLALVYAIAAPSVFTAGERRQLARATAMAYHSLRQARGQAIMTGDVVQRDTALFSRDGVVLTQSAPSGPVVFYPDGSATGTQLVLATENQRASITVDWLTGHVAIGE